MTRRRPTGPSGAALRAARKAAGLSQTELARKAQIGRDAVSYWECKPTIDPKGWAVRKMAGAEPKIADLLHEWATNTREREMGLTGRGDLQGSAAIRTRAGMGLSAGLSDYAAPNAGARNGSNSLNAFLEAVISREHIRMQEKAAQRLARLRVICGAKTTRNGTPCRNKSEPGKRRCKHHGGRSTGPWSAEGKAVIAEAQRARWALWREKRTAGLS